MGGEIGHTLSSSFDRVDGLVLRPSQLDSTKFPLLGMRHLSLVCPFQSYSSLHEPRPISLHDIEPRNMVLYSDASWEVEQNPDGTLRLDVGLGGFVC